MENAYNLAMQIADNLTIKRFLDHIEPQDRETYKDKTWLDLVKIIDSEKKSFTYLKEGHQKTFQAAYEVLKEA